MSSTSNKKTYKINITCEAELVALHMILSTPENQGKVPAILAQITKKLPPVPSYCQTAV